MPPPGIKSVIKSELMLCYIFKYDSQTLYKDAETNFQTMDTEIGYESEKKGNIYEDFNGIAKNKGVFTWAV